MRFEAKYYLCSETEFKINKAKQNITTFDSIPVTRSTLISSV